MLGGQQESAALNKILDGLGTESRREVLLKVLQCSDTSAQYRQANSRLIGFLLDPETVKTIFELVGTSSIRADHKNLMSLYQSSNTSLHRVFADDKNLTQIAVNTLESTDKQTEGYAAGMISRFIGRAFDLWPEDTTEIFFASTNIFAIVIKNVHRSVVFQVAADLMNDASHPGLKLFLWYSLLAISKPDEREDLLKNHRPQFAFFEEATLWDGNPENRGQFVDLSGPEYKLHRQNIISLLRQYFEAMKKYRDNTFSKTVIQWIIKQDATLEEFEPSIFDLASEIGADIAISKMAFKVISSSQNHLLVERATNYLAHCVPLVKETDENKKLEKFSLLQIVYRNLTNNELSCFALQATHALSKSFLELIPETKFEISNIMGYAWTEYTKIEKDQRMNYKPYAFILDLALIFANTEKPIEIELEGWKEFVDAVIKKYWAPLATENIAEPISPDQVTNYSLSYNQEIIDSIANYRMNE